jgi:hypothetical protein
MSFHSNEVAVLLFIIVFFFLKCVTFYLLVFLLDLARLDKIFFSNIAYENDTFITQFSEENRRLHH